MEKRRSSLCAAVQRFPSCLFNALLQRPVRSNLRSVSSSSSTHITTTDKDRSLSTTYSVLLPLIPMPLEKAKSSRPELNRRSSHCDMCVVFHKYELQRVSMCWRRKDEAHYNRSYELGTNEALRRARWEPPLTRQVRVQMTQAALL